MKWDPEQPETLPLTCSKLTPVKILTILSTLGLFLTLELSAQDLNPVSWEYEVIEEATGRIALNMTATMDQGWHLYATTLPSDEGPIATTVQVKSTDHYTPVGELECPTPITEYDPNFGMDVNYYKKKVVFKQTLKIIGERPVDVSGSIEFMCCNGEMCLPPRAVPIKATLK